MFATRHRSRPRRSARFVPTVDGLQARIAPVAAVPADCDLTMPEEPTTPPEEIGAPVPQDEPMVDENMERVFAAIDRMMLTTGAEI